MGEGEGQRDREAKAERSRTAAWERCQEWLPGEKHSLTEKTRAISRTKDGKAVQVSSGPSGNPRQIPGRVITSATFPRRAGGGGWGSGWGWGGSGGDGPPGGKAAGTFSNTNKGRRRRQVAPGRLMGFTQTERDGGQARPPQGYWPIQETELKRWPLKYRFGDS